MSNIIGKVVIFNNKDDENYWIEEPFREEYYRSQIELQHYLNEERAKHEFYNDTRFDEFVNEYITKHGATSGDITVFVKELQAFLKTHKKESTKDNRIG